MQTSSSALEQKSPYSGASDRISTNHSWRPWLTEYPFDLLHVTKYTNTLSFLQETCGTDSAVEINHDTNLNHLQEMKVARFMTARANNQVAAVAANLAFRGSQLSTSRRSLCSSSWISFLNASYRNCEMVWSHAGRRIVQPW